MEYFSDPVIPNSITSNYQLDRVFDITDNKWLHPLLRDITPDLRNPEDMSWKYLDVDTSDEEKLQIGLATAAFMAEQGANMEHTCEVTEYEVPGCPEEPEVSTTVYVYRPKGIEGVADRVLFMPMGGGLFVAEHTVFFLDEMCEKLNCVAVVPKFRCVWEAKYPAAMNDNHAAYKWMLDNAEELQIDPDRVVIMGTSSGAHLALSLGFRLKRFGWHGHMPRGIVAVEPQTDDREHGGIADYLYDGSWDAYHQHDDMRQYLGKDFASSRIGPEALANHATIEECIGYPPVFFHVPELDPDRDGSRELFHKMLEAKTFAEYHAWGGTKHNSCNFTGAFMFRALGPENEFSKRTNAVVYANMCDCWDYDLSRPWVTEE